jgi:SAM-dependent methyltransferase
MTTERDYLLGTHDAELERLGLQHRVWRPRALDAWRRAGFTHGQTILDVGCGPGYGSVDLAGIVGSQGRVVSMDRSRRFLDFLGAVRESRCLEQIETHELDLEHDALPVSGADASWSRWVLAFLKEPRALLERVVQAVRPGGTLVLHEYLDYSAWRLAPRLPELEELVGVVVEAWRADGGEPDVGLQVPKWLGEMDCEIRELRPLVDVVSPGNFVWQWPKTFIEVGLPRLTELGRLTPERARAIRAAFDRAEAAPHTLMLTPVVLEVIATRK